MKILFASLACALAIAAGCVPREDGFTATRIFKLDIRRAPSAAGTASGATAEAEAPYEELFNTRLPDWRSEKVVSKIVQLYRSSYPTSTTPDEEIIESLSASEIKLERGSQNISITVHANKPHLAAALANVYAEAIDAFTEEQNKIRRDRDLAAIHALVEKQIRTCDELEKKLLDFRFANKLEGLRTSRDMIKQGLAKTNADILELEPKAAMPRMAENIQGRIEPLRKKQAELLDELSSVEQRIIATEGGIAKLESEVNVAREVLKSLLLARNDQIIKAEANDEHIIVGPPAAVPTARR